MKIEFTVKKDEGAYNGTTLTVTGSTSAYACVSKYDPALISCMTEALKRRFVHQIEINFEERVCKQHGIARKELAEAIYEAKVRKNNYQYQPEGTPQ